MEDGSDSFVLVKTRWMGICGLVNLTKELGFCIFYFIFLIINEKVVWKTVWGWMYGLWILYPHKMVGIMMYTAKGINNNLVSDFCIGRIFNLFIE